MEKITIFTHEFPPIIRSGVGNTARLLSEFMLNEGFELNILTLKFGCYSSLPSIEKKKGLTIRRLDIPVYERLVFTAFESLYSLLNRKIFSGCSLVHALDTREAPLLCKSLPLVVNCNDYIAADFPILPWKFSWPSHDKPKKYAYYMFTKFVESASLRMADAVIANSAYTAESVSRAYGTRPDKLRVVYKGVSFHDFPVVRKKAGQILFVGGNLECKGINEFIEAMAIVKKRHKVSAVVVGGANDVDYIKRISGKVRQLGLGNSVNFRGHVPHEDVMRMYSESEMFVLPTYRDGLCQAVIEAMAAGLPVVSTNVGGVPEVVDNGRDGVLVEPYKVKELADAIENMLDDKAAAKEMAERGREKIARKFSVDGMLKGYMKVYNELI